MRLGDFEVYRALLQGELGVDIKPEKTYLLESRLSPVFRKWGYPTIESMTLALRAVPDPAMIHDVVQALTDNETWFFRDPANYQALQSIVIPYLIKQRKRQKKIHIWSAGCASGQEAWSLAMAASEALEGHKNWTFDILATDISNEGIEYAGRAIYNQHEAQNETSIKQLIKFFEQSQIGWNVKDHLKERVSFHISNLLHQTEDWGVFDVIFCCNVIHEFTPEARDRVLDTLAYHLADDGFLFVGGLDQWQDETQLFTALPDQPHVLIRAKGDYKFADFPKAEAKVRA
ncbi:MAG: protein-glutamate O-methyltransferase CheR [Micavibrio aeruginosavorus]|uniref:protein-glutamate O-methyltransferase n=1 Tax=Micavibrio aeruginosavorus TaxID=349221 RepID=A0A7T5R1T3_9BACT|nr:MAG: protein-glutamate O-methyltransferase CheR [Micavibrio aeruginosavorus]